MWLPELEIGYFPVADPVSVYDGAYFSRYQSYAATQMGRDITAARMALVSRWRGDGDVLDVGIGCGSFIDARANTWGWDVNPVALAWLRDRNKLWNPYQVKCEAASLWDVLEHVADISALLDRVKNFLFLSVPIFVDADAVLRSRHFRKDEHIWYFTDAGLIRLLETYGWHLLESNDAETALGREGIRSYAFARRGYPAR